jgi:hypothetical protein
VAGLASTADVEENVIELAEPPCSYSQFVNMVAY